MKRKLKETATKALFKVKNNKVVGRSVLYLEKYNPEILTGVGIVAIIGGTVMACKATLKVEEILDEAKDRLDTVKDVKEQVENGIMNVTYDDKTANRDKTIIYIQSSVKLIKLYLPSITLSIAGIGCILGAHNIMKKRNAALLVAYKGVTQAFDDYRKRVVEEYGEEKDRDFRYGIRREEVIETEVGEDGKKKKVKKEEIKIDKKHYSQYARFFDELSPRWSKVPEYNLMFLKTQQNYANDLLRSRGHIFLNEVYDMLGIPRTQAGAIVGWVLDGRDGFVDFGMYDINNEKAREFVNGREAAILLDFNVDGVIYDLI